MPNLDELFGADAAHAIGRRRDTADQIAARQSDGATFDMRALGAAIANSIMQSDDPQQFAGLNAGVRVPTTLTHPAT